MWEKPGTPSKLDSVPTNTTYNVEGKKTHNWYNISKSTAYTIYEY